LRGKKDELLLGKVFERWSNQKYMTRFLSGRFAYLDKHYIPSRSLPSLEETSYLSFYSLVGDEIPLKYYSIVFLFS
jgi:cullin 1